MDAEEEEDDDDEEDITHGDGEIDKSQTESQSEPRAEDSQVMEDVGGDEDKENTSSIYSEDSWRSRSYAMALVIEVVHSFKQYYCILTAGDTKNELHVGFKPWFGHQNQTL